MMTTPHLPLSIMETWSPEQRLAVYDLCRLISESLWQQDRDGLLEAMIRDDEERGFDHAGNLELPFEELEAPAFERKVELTREHVLGVVRTWSRVVR